MATGTIVAYRLAVYILMAGKAFRWGLIEYQGCVAKFAIGLRVGTFQWKARNIVVVLDGAVVYGPPGRVVAFHAIHTEIIPMGGLRPKRKACE